MPATINVRYLTRYTPLQSKISFCYLTYIQQNVSYYQQNECQVSYLEMLGTHHIAGMYIKLSDTESSIYMTVAVMAGITQEA